MAFQTENCWIKMVIVCLSPEVPDYFNAKTISTFLFLKMGRVLSSYFPGQNKKYILVCHFWEGL